jgi:uncharacterized protein YecE (DUF72 family)
MSRRRPERAHIGCSGWNYKSWKGTFYAPGLPPHQWLSAYAEFFDTTEVNNSFYRLPEADVFEKWRTQTPDGFVFAVKASRFLTHMKRLRDPAEPVRRLFSRVCALGPKLGPILYQLPAHFRIDLDSLRGLLETIKREAHLLPEGHTCRTILEFRDPSWYVPDVFDLLSRFDATMCLHDKLGSRAIGPEIGPFLYVRFHGTTGTYAGSYGDDALASWADRIAHYVGSHRPAYAYFNNDPEAVAVRNALALRQLVDERLASTDDSRVTGAARRRSPRQASVRAAATWPAQTMAGGRPRRPAKKSTPLGKPIRRSR